MTTVEILGFDAISLGVGFAAGVLVTALVWAVAAAVGRSRRRARQLTTPPPQETLPTPVPEGGAGAAVGAHAGAHAGAQTEPANAEAPAEAAGPPPPDPTPALQLLSALQREGRFIDFLQEDVAAYSDADVGGAARVVHEGCRRALAEYVDLAPVRSEAEGAPVTLEADFDPAKVRLTGQVAGKPPFHGKLAHHGWRATEVRLPPAPSGRDPNVVAPAEVEVGS